MSSTLMPVVRGSYPHQHIINVLAGFDLRLELLPTSAALRMDVGLLQVEIGELKVPSCR